jgi:hypothetical protein
MAPRTRRSEGRNLVEVVKIANHTPSLSSSVEERAGVRSRRRDFLTSFVTFASFC